MQTISFDPQADLPPFTAFRCPYRFSEGDEPEPKRFVVLGHQNGYAICLKATSKFEQYLACPERLAWVVEYAAASLEFFPQRTAIQPDNQFPIPHTALQLHHANRQLQVLGALPADFPARLRAAVGASTVMRPKQKQRVLAFLPPSD